MDGSKPWHEQDSFWELVESVLFHSRRISAAPAEVEKIITLSGVEPGESVLDLCCGVGRHSFEFTRRGFRVTAVDRTRRYIDRAIQVAQTEGLKVEFVLEDMRKFVRPESFDLALSLFTSFGYFEDPEDDRRVASNIYCSLKAGGVLVMDLMGKEALARIFTERGWSEDAGTIVLEERKLSDAWNWIENRWIVLRDGERREVRLGHRLYAASELTALLKSCGFEAADAYGDLEGAPYDQTARRLVVVARK